MKIVIISNALTPHQLPLCDALAERIDEFKFIEAENIDKTALPLGWRETRKRDYVVPYDYLMTHRAEVEKLILSADAVIMGGDRTEFVKNRLDKGLLTFEYSERIYRRFKDYLKIPYHYFKFRKRYKCYSNLHLLCASAFTYSDFRKIGCFANRAYKWGYFINVPDLDIEPTRLQKLQKHKIRILWVARLLELKHPEAAINVAKRLRMQSVDFEMAIYGEGPLYDRILTSIRSEVLNDYVTINKPVPNTELMQVMKDYDIFLFTSDKKEGWGVVANEAMANACALIGSSAIGSVPYLVKNNYNGKVYRDGNMAQLEACVLDLINDPEKRIDISINAYKTMHDVWSPQNAAANFIKLVNDLNSKRECAIVQGPGSKAEQLQDDWF